MNLTISPKRSTAVKICGITKIDQAITICSMGVNAIGVIGVKESPRFLESAQRRKLFQEVINTNLKIERVLVVADINDDEIAEIAAFSGQPSIIQLHGSESPERCKFLQKKYPMFKWWKAFQIRNEKNLSLIKSYEKAVDAFLLDAWSIDKRGGTGKRIPIEWLKDTKFKIPWWLAGGISKEWVLESLDKINPYGIDASSKLEKSPGIKDLTKVKALIESVRN